MCLLTTPLKWLRGDKIMCGIAGWIGQVERECDDRKRVSLLLEAPSSPASSSWLDGDGCARLLHDAMARWKGVHLVDDMRVSDIWLRQRPHISRLRIARTSRFSPIL